MAEIRLEGVSKVFQKSTRAVQDIDLEIRDKEFVVLVGPSGCGKSTILRMIAGLEEVSEGKLYIDRILVNDLPPKDRNIAIVFQNYALYPHMTAYENLAFGLKINKVHKKTIREKVRKAAAILEIEDLLDRKPKAMSGGQNQRVAIGRAIVREPKVFLFDEPLSNLDANLRVQMRIEIAKLHKRLDATVVYVTHDQVEAMTLGDRIVILDKGRIQQVDTPSELYANPANMFVAGFIGTPPMNFIEGSVYQIDEGIMFSDPSHSFEVNLPSDHPLSSKVEMEVVLGIRSEDIYNQANPDVDHFKVFSCKIEFVEKLGHEIYAYILLQNQQIISRLKADTEIEKGSKINLYFDKRKMYFFDKLTGLRI